MDLLYRWGGPKGPEIGALFGISYSAVNQAGKRLWNRLAEDNDPRKIMAELERILSLY